MKKTITSFLLLAIALSLSTKTVAQIIDGSFESQLSAPRGKNNVQGPGAVYNDFSTWQGVSIQAGSSIFSFCGTADYLATNATAPEVNPFGSPSGGTFTPRTGRGCVAITREPYSTAYDQFVTQAVALTVGRTYRATFYARRRPIAQYADKLALLVTDAAPVYSLTSTGREILPTPYATIVSQPIADDQNWMPVSGTFTARASTSYITIGYDRSFANSDTSLPTVNPNGGYEYVAIDDVSLTEVVCTMPDAPVFNIVPKPQGNGASQTYNVAVSNGDPSNINFTLRLTQPYPPYTQIGYIYNLDRYTGTEQGNNPPLYNFQGFTTFPTGLIGPEPGTGEGNTYRMEVTVQNTCGATTTSVRTITLPANTGPGENPYIVAPTSPTASATAAYPNPTADMLLVTVPTQQNTQIVLYNAYGQEQVVKQQANGTQTKLDVRYLPAGVYHLRITRKGEPTVNKQVVIRH